MSKPQPETESKYSPFTCKHCGADMRRMRGEAAIDMHAEGWCVRGIMLAAGAKHGAIETRMNKFWQQARDNYRETMLVSMFVELLLLVGIFVLDGLMLLVMLRK